MQVFYAPGIKGNRWILDENESRHCVRVLRMTKGSSVRLIDGKGSLFEGMITIADPRRCEIEICGVITDFEKRNYRLHIAISPIKNPDRFEWFVEKSVEIGVDEITPLICKNTEKHSIKRERVNGIIISAMKQSLKAGLTVLNEAVTFNEFISSKNNGIKLIAHCRDAADKQNIGDRYNKGENGVILIGPEGDFSEDEIVSAVAAGFRQVHLGKSRLRTETAGIAACHSIYFLNQ